MFCYAANNWEYQYLACSLSEAPILAARGIPFQKLLIKGAVCITNWRPLSGGVSGSRHSWARRQISTTQSSFPVFSSAECCDDTLALLNRPRNERAPSRVALADSHARLPNPQS